MTLDEYEVKLKQQFQEARTRLDVLRDWRRLPKKTQNRFEQEFLKHLKEGSKTTRRWMRQFYEV